MSEHHERERVGQLLGLAEQLFEDGFYQASHHALLSGLCLAESIHDPVVLKQVGAQAARHRRLINQLQPDHELSDLAPARRGTRGVYQNLELRVASLELAWQLENEHLPKPPRRAVRPPG